jgi:hypothetical protein
MVEPYKLPNCNSLNLASTPRLTTLTEKNINKQIANTKYILKTMFIFMPQIYIYIYIYKEKKRK